MTFGVAPALPSTINSGRYADGLFGMGFQGQEGMNKDRCTNYSYRQNHNFHITFSSLVDCSKPKIRSKP